MIRWICTALTLALIVVSASLLERNRSELLISKLTFSITPIVLYELTNSIGPAVTAAHGFAGSIQLMQACSSNLARAGYRVVAFDF